MREEITFQVTVNGTDNYEWQGEIKMSDGTKLPFCSVIELLKEMKTKIDAMEEER